MSPWLTGVRARSSRRSTATRGPVLRRPTPRIRPASRSSVALGAGRRGTNETLPLPPDPRNARARGAGRVAGGPAELVGAVEPDRPAYSLQTRAAGQGGAGGGAG